MAGDWIKMRVALTTDPKVAAIGSFLAGESRFIHWLTCGEHDSVIISDGALRHFVTGALHTVWCAANEHANGEFVFGADLSWIDLVSGVELLGKAMEKVGWAKTTPEGLQLPKFCANNTSGAERQKKYRERKTKSDVTRDVTRVTRSDESVCAREEKRREEKSNTPCSPPSGKKPPGELDPGWLYREWMTFYKGPSNKSNDAKGVTEIIADMIARGIRPEAIRDNIRDKDRRKAETIWEFDKRMTVESRSRNGPATPTPEEAQATSAEAYRQAEERERELERKTADRQAGRL